VRLAALLALAAGACTAWAIVELAGAPPRAARRGALVGWVAAVGRRVGVPRAESLEALARRAPLPGVRALVAAIGRADRHGAPLGPALSALATQARTDRARAAREAAARAAPKVQLVVAALLVPGAMLLIASALLGALTG